MDAFRHCEQVVRAADKDRYLATLFAPADVRGSLFSLYAFNVEIASVRDRVREPMAGEIRLQWWRDVLNGERPGEMTANPVAAGLVETISQFSLPVPRLRDLIEAHAFDLYDDPMPRFDALEGYARETEGVVFGLASRICGGSADDAAEQAGIAYALTALMRRFALHASRQQLFLPVEALEGSTTPEEICIGRSSPSLLNALGMLGHRARHHLKAAEEALAQLPSAAVPAFLPLSLVPGYLGLMEDRRYDPFRTAIEIPQWRRQWTLWRAARRYARLMRG